MSLLVTDIFWRCFKGFQIQSCFCMHVRSRYFVVVAVMLRRHWRSVKIVWVRWSLPMVFVDYTSKLLMFSQCRSGSALFNSISSLWRCFLQSFLRRWGHPNWVIFSSLVLGRPCSMRCRFNSLSFSLCSRFQAKVLHLSQSGTISFSLQFGAFFQILLWLIAG